MKKLMTAALLFGLLLSIHSAAYAGEIDWIHSMDTALEKAQTENKLIVVYLCKDG
jgi:hypothetical protein